MMDWAPLLEPGEKVLWSGRPAPRCYTFRNGAHSLAGLVLLLPTLVWWWLGRDLAAGGGSAMAAWLPVPFLLVALYLVAGHLVLARLEWEGLFYALTDRRVLVLRGWPRRRLREIPLCALRYFSLRPLGADLATLKLLADPPSRPLNLCCLEHPSLLTPFLEEAIALREPSRGGEIV